jgi:hypothetical protein
LLDELHELNPNSTFVFNFRPVADWIRSVTGWNALKVQFARFLMPGLVMTPDQQTKRCMTEGIGEGW